MLSRHMDASGKRKRHVPDAADEPAVDPAADPGALATGRDPHGVPVHRGWAPLGGRHRWMEPFVLALLADAGTHGYAIVAELEEMGIAPGSVDVGQVYRTLRDLEAAGQVTSSWSAAPSGPQRRDYRLTEPGFRALDEWAAVMKDRARLIAEFDALYLASLARPRE
jgi:PadR family transcriptional regulator, regulatory protein PadR